MTEVSKDSLGDRMKAYEREWQGKIPSRQWTVVRIDGRAFHTWTRSLLSPFDMQLVDVMGGVMLALCQDMSGAVFAYAQSDEISVLLTDFARPNSQAYFDGKIQKITSVAASVATGEFNHRTRSCMRLEHKPPAFFDARAFTLPSRDEVRNYFLWRQQDAERNAISMVAASRFSHKQLMHKTVQDRRDMLKEAGVDLGSYSPLCMRGQMAWRERRLVGPVEYVDKRGRKGVSEPGMRWVWSSGPATTLDCQPGSFLDETLPYRGEDDTVTVVVTPNA